MVYLRATCILGTENQFSSCSRPTPIPSQCKQMPQILHEAPFSFSHGKKEIKISCHLCSIPDCFSQLKGTMTFSLKELLVIIAAFLKEAFRRSNPSSRGTQELEEIQKFFFCFSLRIETPLTYRLTKQNTICINT